ncbi:MAG: cytochrome P450 [Solirubrobacteraceae bacterium]|nr:cytochrome P450 [Solirubrobacteraceae bacterium]
MATVETIAPAVHLVGEAAPSPAGPVEPGTPVHLPPAIELPRTAQLVRFSQRQIEFVFKARREHGEVFGMRSILNEGITVTSHPDHVRSLFTAKPDQAPSLTAESPLRPIVGPNSVLTANGPRHLRQRKLLLPPFHGEAIARYTEMIEEATHREIDRWPIGEPIKLAERMQAITLDVIMSGIFGIEGKPVPGSHEDKFRDTIKFLTKASTSIFAQFGEILSAGQEEARGFLKRGVKLLDAATYPIIEDRRRADDLEERTDIMSLLMRATDEDGRHLSDQELRDELLTLVLAGFETTANSLSWTWERLMRTPDAYDLLYQAVRSGDQADEVVEATITEGMRARPVIPMIGRRVMVPWRLGEYVLPANSPISMSILLVHHREDLYPEPFAFRPERWLANKPGTYEWIPFGGGTRRCLGAALAMAEMRVVLKAMAERLELEADRPEPEHAMHRNVTMIPGRGARAIVRSRA